VQIHAIKAYRGSRSKSSQIINLGTRWIPHPLILGKGLSVPAGQDAKWTLIVSLTLEAKKKILFLSGNESHLFSL
jgi:hypothetical protein